MKILLVEPREHPAVIGLSRFICAEPLALEILAANLLPGGHEVRILDLRLDQDLEGALYSFQPELVGVTGYTQDAAEMLRIAGIVKRLSPDTFVMIGGHHATMCPADFNGPAVDAIVMGDGERVVRKLADRLQAHEPIDQLDGLYLRLNGRWVTTGHEDAVESLDETPFPNRDLVSEYRNGYYFWYWDSPALVETARGCPFRCNYCSVWTFNRGTSRFRCAEGVLEEIRQLPSPVKSVFFADDHFLQHIPRAVKLASLLDESGVKLRYSFQTRSDSVSRRPDVIEKWAKVGLMTAFLGIEAIRQEELDAMHKSNSVRVNNEAVAILQANGVHIWGAFIVDPKWDVDDFSMLIDYVHSSKIDFPQFTIMTPLPGTEIFPRMRPVLTETQHHLYDVLHAVVPTKLPLDKFYEQMARLYREATVPVPEILRLIRSGDFPINALRRAKNIWDRMTNPESYLEGHNPACFGPPMAVANTMFRGTEPGLELVPAWAETTMA
jgi:radical SAM superfamily enzyme YgiQ (UPF0313 family)